MPDDASSDSSERDLSRETSWLTINEACDECEVTRRTIYNWIAKGRLEVRRTAGGTIRIAERSLWRNVEESPWRR